MKARNIWRSHMSTSQLSLRLVQVLHGPSACVADQDLLRLLGSGNIATPRDVAWAIVQEALGLAELEDRSYQMDPGFATLPLRHAEVVVEVQQNCSLEAWRLCSQLQTSLTEWLEDGKLSCGLEWKDHLESIHLPSRGVFCASFEKLWPTCTVPHPIRTIGGRQNFFLAPFLFREVSPSFAWEDHRFSWTNLAYLGGHWMEILQSGATELGQFGVLEWWEDLWSAAVVTQFPLSTSISHTFWW